MRGPRRSAAGKDHVFGLFEFLSCSVMFLSSTLDKQNKQKFQDGEIGTRGEGQEPGEHFVRDGLQRQSTSTKGSGYGGQGRNGAASLGREDAPSRLFECACQGW